MTQTISIPEENSTSLGSHATKRHERRTNIRKAPEQLVYLSLPSNNGGILLDVSEGGLGFHSIAPVPANGPIHFRFAIGSGAKVKGVGELAWIDKTGKVGGLRFTQLPDEAREQIRVWTSRSKTSTTTMPAICEESAAATTSTSSTSAAVDHTVASRAVQSEAMPLDESGYAFSVGIQTDEAAVEARVPSGRGAAWASGLKPMNPVLYSLRPPIYSAPHNAFSMFPLNVNSEAAAAVAVRESVARPDSVASWNSIGLFDSTVRRNPVAAIGLTIVLALFVSIGIIAYLSTSGAGELLLSWGEEIWSALQSQPPSQSPAPPASFAPGSPSTVQY